MTPEVFDSSTFSSILSWLFCAPILLWMFTMIFSIYKKMPGVPLALSIWIGICLFIFSPIRYVLFLIVAATCYPAQSFYAFATTFILAFYVPIVFGLLFIIGFAPPLLAFTLVLGPPKRTTFIRTLAASIMLPVGCLIGSMLFYLVLPYAGWTLHWLQARDVIRATNGPTIFVWRTLIEKSTPYRLPAFYRETPQTPQDELRCHVAGVYLRDKQVDYFFAHQYPHLYREMLKETPNR